MKRQKMKTIKILLVLLLSALVAVSGFMIIREITVQEQEKDAFNDLRELIVVTDEKEDTPDTTGQTKTETTELAEDMIDLSALLNQNKECVGWIRIADTNIDYPVMHTPQSPQKYLRKNFYGEYSQSGVPFLDARCSLEDGNLLIYGHNMKNGTMFSDLKNYLNSNYKTSHNEIVLYTESEQITFIITDVIKTDIYDERYENFKTDGDRLLMLSTCYGSAKNGRLLIIAKEAKNNA